MAYDSARRVTVLFGGYGGNQPLDETWEWDGTTWVRDSESGPVGRLDPAMAFDSARGVTVLFGGFSNIAQSARDQETWEWNGASWALVADTQPPAGPSGRRNWVMAYDAARGVSLLYGGTITPSGSRTGELWAWDGTDWTLLQPASFPSPNRPVARDDTALVYDSSRQVTILFGGVNFPGGPNNRGDTWEWDGTSWTRIADTGPAPRRFHAMAFDSVRDVTVLTGGDAFQAGFPLFADTWEWDGTNWTQVASGPPSDRKRHDISFDSGRGVTVLFGGARGGFSYLNDTWELPSCPVDSDGDGVNDPDDECDFSDLRFTVVIDGCDSGVANQLFDDGCTMADRIAACAEEAGNHGAFVRCVAELTNTWVRDETITSRDKGPITRCAARANLPQRHEERTHPKNGLSTSRIEALSRL